MIKILQLSYSIKNFKSSQKKFIQFIEYKFQSQNLFDFKIQIQKCKTFDDLQNAIYYVEQLQKPQRNVEYFEEYTQLIYNQILNLDSNNQNLVVLKYFGMFILNNLDLLKKEIIAHMVIQLEIKQNTNIELLSYLFRQFEVILIRTPLTDTLSEYDLAQVLLSIFKSKNIIDNDAFHDIIQKFIKSIIKRKICNFNPEQAAELINQFALNQMGSKQLFDLLYQNYNEKQSSMDNTQLIKSAWGLISSEFLNFDQIVLTDTIKSQINSYFQNQEYCNQYYYNLYEYSVQKELIKQRFSIKKLIFQIKNAIKI